MNKGSFIAAAAAIILLSLAWVLLTPVLFPGVEAQGTVTAAHPGFAAPGFTLQTFEGETVTLSDHKGQPVLVFLWASWCSVCKATMPGLQEVYEDYAPKGFEILAVNTNFQDTLSAAENYYRDQGYTFPALIDRDGSVSRDYQMHAVPTSVLIDPEGVVVDVVIGSGMSEGYLRAQLDQILTGEE